MNTQTPFAKRMLAAEREKAAIDARYARDQELAQFVLLNEGINPDDPPADSFPVRVLHGAHWIKITPIIGEPGEYNVYVWIASVTGG